MFLILAVNLEINFSLSVGDKLIVLGLVFAFTFDLIFDFCQTDKC